MSTCPPPLPRDPACRVSQHRRMHERAHTHTHQGTAASSGVWDKRGRDRDAEINQKNRQMEKKSGTRGRGGSAQRDARHGHLEGELPRPVATPPSHECVSSFPPPSLPLSCNESELQRSDGARRVCISRRLIFLRISAALPFHVCLCCSRTYGCARGGPPNVN